MQLLGKYYEAVEDLDRVQASLGALTNKTAAVCYPMFQEGATYSGEWSGQATAVRLTEEGWA